MSAREAPRKVPTVCMMTGAYPPEVSGGGLQARTLAAALQRTVGCMVITMTTDRALPARDVVDGIPVYRIAVNPRQPVSKMVAGLKLAQRLIALRREVDLIHLHGFSQKTWVVLLLNRWLRKPVVQKLTLLGSDDAVSLDRTWGGRLQRLAYAWPDRLIGVSPALMDTLTAEPALRARARLIPNGVDLTRFRMRGAQEAREALRERLGLPRKAKVILFVGIFAARKDPLTAWRAWREVCGRWGDRLWLVFVGATRSGYYEIDQRLVAQIREEIRQAGCADRVRFIEQTGEIEAYLQSADCFIHPAREEGLPNAVLEAMATGLPCVVARLKGSTDWIIEEGRSGLLFEPGDVRALAEGMQRLLEDEAAARRMGEAARQTIEARFGSEQLAQSYRALYLELLNDGGTPLEAGP